MDLGAQFLKLCRFQLVRSKKGVAKKVIRTDVRCAIRQDIGQFANCRKKHCWLPDWKEREGRIAEQWCGDAARCSSCSPVSSVCSMTWPPFTKPSPPSPSPPLTSRVSSTTIWGDWVRSIVCKSGSESQRRRRTMRSHDFFLLASSGLVKVKWYRAVRGQWLNGGQWVCSLKITFFLNR